MVVVVELVGVPEGVEDGKVGDVGVALGVEDGAGLGRGLLFKA